MAVCGGKVHWEESDSKFTIPELGFISFIFVAVHGWADQGAA